MMIDRELNYGREIVKSFLDKSVPYKMVLDIGAGGGDDLQSAIKIEPEADITAIEFDKSYAEKLRRIGIKVYEFNIENASLPFDNCTIDIVIANQILEHIKEVFWVLHEITRVLRIGGNLIIGVPNLASLHNRILLLLGRHPTPIKTASAHVRGFTKTDILSFLEKCFPGGYQLRALKGSNFYPFPPLFAGPLARAFPTLSYGIFFLLQKTRDYGREFLDYPLSEKLESNFYLG